MLFKDRKEAGKLLARGLEDILLKYPSEPAIIYALPRGGVTVGAEIANALKLPLSLVITRKIGHPQNPEYAICAVAEDGHMLCDPTEQALVDPNWLDEQVSEQREEALRRRRAYLGDDNQPLPAKDKIAVLVDDGIATGLTMRLAIDELRHQEPKRIIVAVPVVSDNMAQLMRVTVDGLVTLHIPEFYLGGVGAYYDDFSQVTDEEVINLLRRSK